jgi:broad specificity phosphatase PhoE
MLELTLVRHSPTALNEQGCYQGRIDPPLSIRGLDEARLLGQRLRNRSFDLVVSSTSRRCRESAGCIAPEYLPVPDGRWLELDFGDWDGRTYDECLANAPDAFRGWISNPLTERPPGGESFGELAARVDEAVYALPREGRALVVTHAGPIRRVLMRTLKLDWTQVSAMRITLSGITRLTLDPRGCQLLGLNDTAHLEAS